MYSILLYTSVQQSKKHSMHTCTLTCTCTCMHTHMYMYMTLVQYIGDYKLLWGTSIRDRLLEHSRIDLKSNLISKVRFPIIYPISNIATKRTSNEIWQIEVTHLSIKVVHSEQLYCREKAQLIDFPGDLEVFTNILFTEGVQ